MTTRILPRDEWPKLAGTEAESVIPHLDALHAEALVVEDGGAIVGCWLLMPVWHAECLWIAPDRRLHASVGRRLLAGLRDAAAGLGIERVWTAALSGDIKNLLERFGATAMPGEHFVMAMKGK